MKQIVNFDCEISINDEKYQNTSIFNCYHYAEPQEDKITVITKWDTFYTEVIKGNIPNCHINKTIFRHTPYVKYVSPYGSWCYKLTKDNFESIKIKTSYKPTQKNFSFSNLQQILSADEFYEWLKDKNILEIFEKNA